MGRQLQLSPALAQAGAGHSHQKRQLQEQIDPQGHSQAHPHRQGHIALGVARFPRQIHRRSKAQQAEQNPAAADRLQNPRQGSLGWGDPQVAPLPGCDHQRDRDQQGHHQLPAGEAIDPAGQPAHSGQIDPGHQHQQQAGDAQTRRAQHLPGPAIGGEPGQITGQVVDHRQHLDGGQGEVGDPGAPAADETGEPAVTQQGDLGEGAGARHQSPQFGKHQGQAKGHHATGHPGQQAGGARTAGGIERGEQPAGSDRAGHHSERQAAQAKTALQARCRWSHGTAAQGASLPILGKVG